jgi:hypothetical protein
MLLQFHIEYINYNFNNSDLLFTKLLTAIVKRVSTRCLHLKLVLGVEFHTPLPVSGWPQEFLLSNLCDQDCSSYLMILPQNKVSRLQYFSIEINYPILWFKLFVICGFKWTRTQFYIYCAHLDFKLTFFCGAICFYSEIFVLILLGKGKNRSASFH